jgi:hypothetical protein
MLQQSSERAPRSETGWGGKFQEGHKDHGLTKNNFLLENIWFARCLFSGKSTCAK